MPSLARQGSDEYSGKYLIHRTERPSLPDEPKQLGLGENEKVIGLDTFQSETIPG